MSPAAELISASVALGGRVALTEASLTVNAGEVLGVVGANGAGKTTLQRALLGLARLTGGQARLGGRPGEVVGREPPALAADEHGEAVGAVDCRCDAAEDPDGRHRAGTRGHGLLHEAAAEAHQAHGVRELQAAGGD